MRTFLNHPKLPNRMANLIACLSTGKGTWGHVSRLIEDGQWDKIVLITNAFGEEKFTKNEKTELVVIENMKGLKELTKDIEAGIKGKVSGEVSLNLISGSGKEHMALLSALNKLGLKYTLTAVTKEGVESV